MQGKLTLRLSSSWLYIVYTSFLFDLTKKKFFRVYLCPFVDELTKRGRRILRVYICMFIFLFNAYMFCLCKKGRRIWWVYACLSPCFMHLCLFNLCTLIEYLIVYCYAWVKGELLWSLTLIHAYITPWFLSSSKGGDCWPKGPSL